MTLEQIDQRLSLYHLYLRYYIDWCWPNFPFYITIDLSFIKPLTPVGLLKLYQQTGNKYFSSVDEPEEDYQLLSFDEWLIKNDYPELAA